MQNAFNYITKLRQNSFRWTLMRALTLIPGTPLKYRISYIFKYTGPHNSKLKHRFSGQIKWGDDKDISKIVESIDRPDKADIFKNRLNNGDKCIVATDKNGVVAGYGWLSLNKRHVEDNTGCVFEFPQSSIYAYDFLVKQEYRLTGIWVGMMQLILDSTYYDPNAGLHCLIDYGNTPSLRTHFRYGFKIYQRKTIITILGKPYIFNKDFEHTDFNINKVLHEKDNKANTKQTQV